ncbi:hypothetical protein BDV18DRAFT_162104 [Aspergillus unguis]
MIVDKLDVGKCPRECPFTFYSSYDPLSPLASLPKFTMFSYISKLFSKSELDCLTECAKRVYELADEKERKQKERKDSKAKELNNLPCRHKLDTWKSIECLEEGWDVCTAIQQRIQRLSQIYDSDSDSDDDDDDDDIYHNSDSDPYEDFIDETYPRDYKVAQPESQRKAQRKKQGQEQAPTEEDRKQELHKLRCLLRDALRRCSEVWYDLPDNAIVDRFRARVASQDDQGRNDLWYHESTVCSLSGGCCARDCGCCDNPLMEYQRRYKNEESGKMEKDYDRVYGHCTMECACCIKAHGVYTPDKRVGNTKFFDC